MEYMYVGFLLEYERQEGDIPDLVERKMKKWSLPEERQGLGRLRMWGRALVGKTVRRYSRLWAQNQGPYTPDLITYLKQNHRHYDALVFITYLYYPTVAGLDVAPRKSIFIPTAHDEISIYLPVFRPVFRKPKAILFLTPAEKRFVHQLFHNEATYNDVLGVGIESVQETTTVSPAQRLGTDAPYLIYIGRIDQAKGCDVLFNYFIQYKENHPSSLKLVLVGQSFMPIPDHPDVVTVGFVEEGVKTSLLKGAKSLVIPSLYESLSMVTLESFAHEIPVIANRNCEVIKDHIDLSRAGLLYTDYTSFEQAIDYILVHDLREMGKKGRQYIKQNYTWNQVLTRFTRAVDYVTG